LTDLTAAYLGFGVLSLNAAYQFKATARYTQQGLGYIGVDGFCFLLAIQCLARGEDRQRIRKLLNSPVAGIFEVAWDTLERDRILEALALPPPEQRPEPLTETPDLLPVTLSPVQRRVLALAEREASRADPDSGLFDLPVPCDFSVGQARQLGLVAWGYFGPGPHRWGGLHLVEVPGLAKHLLVVESGGAGDVETRALGLIDDAVASRREDLVMALEPIFAANGLPGVPFFTELPAYVQWTTKAWVRLGDLKELVLLAVRHLDLDRLEECVERLDRYFDDIWEREPISRQPLPCPRASEAATNLSRQTEKLLNEWWDLARNPDLADEKAARLESRSGSRQT
jgi:hypothetical protein